MKNSQKIRLGIVFFVLVALLAPQSSMGMPRYSVPSAPPDAFRESIQFTTEDCFGLLTPKPKQFMIFGKVWKRGRWVLGGAAVGLAALWALHHMRHPAPVKPTGIVHLLCDGLEYQINGPGRRNPPPTKARNWPQSVDLSGKDGWTISDDKYERDTRSGYVHIHATINRSNGSWSQQFEAVTTNIGTKLVGKCHEITPNQTPKAADR